MPEMLEAKFGSLRFQGLARVCERLSLATANHVIATNDSYRDLAVRRGGKDPRKVTVVRYGATRSGSSIRPLCGTERSVTGG